MNKLLLAAVAAFAFTLASCQSASQPGTTGIQPASSAHAESQLTIPFDIDIFNTCCNENVHITGNEHIVVNGDFTHVHVNLDQLSGVGDNGDIYHGELILNEVVNINAGASEETIRETFTMTSSSGCKFKLILSAHITIDANGNLRVDNETFITECF